MSGPVAHHCLFYDYVYDVLQRREPHRAEHLANVHAWKDDGRILMAGALGDPPYGALFVFGVDDPAQIDEFIAADPYFDAGLITGHHVVPWKVVVS